MRAANRGAFERVNSLILERDFSSNAAVRPYTTVYSRKHGLVRNMTTPFIDRSLLRSFCLVLALAPCAAAAQATQPVPAQAGASYRELIRKAVQEYELGNWAEAKLFFADAHALNPNARTMRGLGLVAYALRNYVEAQTWFQQALDSQLEPLPEKLRIEVSEYLRLSEHFLAHLRVNVDPLAAEIRLDDKPLDPQAMAGGGGATVNPGPHELMISLDGYETLRRHLDLDAAANIELSLRLHSLQPAPPPPQAIPVAALIPPPEPKKPAKEPEAPFIGGWLVAGGSAAVAIAGGVLIVRPCYPAWVSRCSAWAPRGSRRGSCGKWSRMMMRIRIRLRCKLDRTG
jgi:hypothetical protein